MMKDAMPDLPRSHSSRSDPLTEPLSLERIDVVYKGRWVLVKVTAFNELHTPIKGQVVAAGTRKKIQKLLMGMAATGQPPDAPYYYFAAGAFIRPGTEAMRQLMQQSPPQGLPGAAG